MHSLRTQAKTTEDRERVLRYLQARKEEIKSEPDRLKSDPKLQREWVLLVSKLDAQVRREATLRQSADASQNAATRARSASLGNDNGGGGGGGGGGDEGAVQPSSRAALVPSSSSPVSKKVSWSDSKAAKTEDASDDAEGGGYGCGGGGADLNDSDALWNVEVGSSGGRVVRVAAPRAVQGTVDIAPPNARTMASSNDSSASAKIHPPARDAPLSSASAAGVAGQPVELASPEGGATSPTSPVDTPNRRGTKWSIGSSVDIDIAVSSTSPSTRATMWRNGEEDIAA